jgi:KDO2-lipid IV(A) lauroyltransferase
LRWYALRGLRLLRQAAYAVIGPLIVGLMRLLRRVDRTRMANVTAAFMRRVGPWLPEHRVGRANLAAAFPEKTRQEHDEILAGVWDNLGRVAVEFLHLDRITILDRDSPGDADVIYDDTAPPRLQEIKQTGARLIFATHLANWELPARFARHYEVDTTILFRPPNVRAISDAVLELRAGCMGTLVPSGFDAPFRLARALERGGKAGMLVDQHDSRGVEVTFFGRPCLASPLLAKLAREYDCPIHGVRMIRLPDRNRFQADVTDPIEPARGADGRIDVQGTTQRITSVVEGWVREHPEQWLWLHRRWR